MASDPKSADVRPEDFDPFDVLGDNEANELPRRLVTGCRSKAFVVRRFAATHKQPVRLQPPTVPHGDTPALFSQSIVSARPLARCPADPSRLSIAHFRLWRFASGRVTTTDSRIVTVALGSDGA